MNTTELTTTTTTTDRLTCCVCYDDLTKPPRGAWRCPTCRDAVLCYECYDTMKGAHYHRNSPPEECIKCPMCRELYVLHMGRIVKASSLRSVKRDERRHARRVIREALELEQAINAPAPPPQRFNCVSRQTLINILSMGLGLVAGALTVSLI